MTYMWDHILVNFWVKPGHPSKHHIWMLWSCLKRFRLSRESRQVPAAIIVFDRTRVEEGRRSRCNRWIIFSPSQKDHQLTGVEIEVSSKYRSKIYHIPSSYQLPCDYSFIQTLISWRKPADMEDITNKPNTILSQSSTYTSAISRAKINTIKLTTVVIVCYILSSTPFIIGQIIAVFGPAQMARKMGEQLRLYS